MGSGARVAVTAVVVGDDGLGTAGRVVVAHGQLHAVARDYVHIIVGPAYWSKVCSATVAQHAVGLDIAIAAASTAGLKLCHRVHKRSISRDKRARSR